jgi:hypothetical protein
MIADRKKYWIGGSKDCSNAKLAKTCKRRLRILPEPQRKLVVELCQDAYDGKMLGRLHTLLHPEAQLSAQDVETNLRGGAPSLSECGR